MDYLTQLKEILLKCNQQEAADMIGVSLRTVQSYLADDNPSTPHKKKQRKIDEVYTKLITQGIPVELIEKPKKEKEDMEPKGQLGLTYLEKRRAAKNEHTPFMVPLVPVKAQAGYVKSYDDVEYIEKLEKYALPPDVTHIGANWRYWEVEGESMEPELFSGDHILTSQVYQEDWHQLYDFYTYVIVNHNNVWIKRIHKEPGDNLILMSANIATPPKLINLSDINEIWAFRRHIRKQLPAARRYDLDEIRRTLNQTQQ